MVQEREITSGGKMGFRLISTTTRDIDKEIMLGRFRRELYFRINGVCVKLPALRERKASDIPVLMEYFLGKACWNKSAGEKPMLGTEEIEMLESHDWPGNIKKSGGTWRGNWWHWANRKRRSAN